MFLYICDNFPLVNGSLYILLPLWRRSCRRLCGPKIIILSNPAQPSVFAINSWKPQPQQPPQIIL